MVDAAHADRQFVDMLASFVAEVASGKRWWEHEDDADPGVPAAKLGPLADGLVSTLAASYAKQLDDRTRMEGMKLDELLAYLGEALGDDEIRQASTAAAKILAALRWFHYGRFVPPGGEDELDLVHEAGLLQAGLEHLMTARNGGRVND